VLIRSFAVIRMADQPRGAMVDERLPLEDHPEWRDQYCFSKQRQEVLAWRYAEDRRLPLAVVRPGVMMGPNENILDVRIGKAGGGIFLSLGGDNLLPLTYLANCAEAIALAGFVQGIEGEVFCIVDDDLPTCNEILKRYREEVDGLRVVRIPYPLLKA